jgi:LmbE family N-acetylglucosaminyl deacetylase
MRPSPSSFLRSHSLPALLGTSLIVAALGLLAPARPGAAGIVDTRGEVGLALILRKLATVGTVMHVTAHPDDENSALMALQSHGEGLRVVLATATRGNGGQNEIGPEIFEALGVLRTEELLAAHRNDGAEQFFARAVDFGYSFSVEETLEKWGREEILGDYVHLIRLTRPDVMITMRPDGGGGGQHHQTSARIGLEAFRAAADPTKYPEQIKEGLRPWQPLKAYEARFYGFFRGEQTPPPDMKLVATDADVYDPLLGRTYAEIGSEARAMHKCQGFGQLLALPGPWVVKYLLADTVLDGQKNRDEATLFDGVDVTLRGLAHFAGPRPPSSLVSGLADVSAAVKTANERLRLAGPDGAVSPLAAGLTAARALRDRLHTLELTDEAVYEIDFRLSQTIHKFEQALVLANGLRLEALADDGVVTPGEPLKVRLIAANRGRQSIASGVPVLEGVEGSAPACAVGDIPSGGVVECEASVTVPTSARVTEPYWTRKGEAGRYVFDPDAPFGLPFRPTPFRAHFDFTIGGVDVPVDLPVAYRYEGNIFSGEKRMDLLVVPALSVNVSPDIAIVPAVAPGPVSTAAGGVSERARPLQVVVTHNAPGEADAEVSLDVPAGWRLEPAMKRVTFARPDEQATVRFTVEPPAVLSAGTYPIAARVVSGGLTWTRGYQVIEYPHIHRQHIYSDATVTIKALDVKLPAGLHVGYVMGAGDQVPPAIEQLGATLQMLDEQDLATGDLHRFDAIVTGVRAYERRKDLRTYNQRLLDYVEHGGTLIVQYNKFEFNQAQYGPYPAKVSSSRVTDQNAPVTVLAPDDPVFNRPNRITAATWEHWVQERGLYFLGDRDPRYVDLVELADPFPFNAGPKRGALVEAKVGSGHWVYVGLNLWRQLPAGTEGAYELLANLLSLGSAQKSATLH